MSTPSPSARKSHRVSKYSEINLSRVTLPRSLELAPIIKIKKDPKYSRSKNPLNRVAFVSAGHERAPPEPEPARFGSTRVERWLMAYIHNNRQWKSWYINHSTFLGVSNVRLSIKGKLRENQVFPPKPNTHPTPIGKNRQ